MSAVLARQHVVVATATASGKSLCYNGPVLKTLLEDPSATALYLFPTKALSHDQLRALSTLADALDRTAAEHPEEGGGGGAGDPTLTLTLPCYTLRVVFHSSK